MSYVNCSLPLLLVPQGNSSSGEGAGDVDETLVAATTKAQGDVAFSLDKWTLDKDIKFLHDIEQGCIGDNFLPSVAGVAPHVVTQFLLDAVDERACALGLLQGITATQGDGRLVIGNDLHQLIKSALFPTLEVP